MHYLNRRIARNYLMNKVLRRDMLQSMVHFNYFDRGWMFLAIAMGVAHNFVGIDFSSRHSKESLIIFLYEYYF